VIDRAFGSNFEIVFALNSFWLFKMSTYKIGYYWHKNSLDKATRLARSALQIDMLTSRMKPISGELRILILKSPAGSWVFKRLSYCWMTNSLVPLRTSNELGSVWLLLFNAAESCGLLISSI
jgi:hypothetical protein